MTQHQGRTLFFPKHELNGFAVRLSSLIGLIVRAIIAGCARRHYFGGGGGGGGVPQMIFSAYTYLLVLAASLLWAA